MTEATMIWTVIGTGVGMTGILLTVLLTVMTMQGRAINARFDDQSQRFTDQNALIEGRFNDQNAMIQARFADQNAMIEGRFNDQSQRIGDLGNQLNQVAADMRELRTHVFQTRSDRHAAAG